MLAIIRLWTGWGRTFDRLGISEYFYTKLELCHKTCDNYIKYFVKFSHNLTMVKK